MHLPEPCQWDLQVQEARWPPASPSPELATLILYDMSLTVEGHRPQGTQATGCLGPNSKDPHSVGLGGAPSPHLLLSHGWKIGRTLCAPRAPTVELPGFRNWMSLGGPGASRKCLCPSRLKPAAPPQKLTEKPLQATPGLGRSAGGGPQGAPRPPASPSRGSIPRAVGDPVP